MKIISRYVVKEHLGPFLFALSALTSLMLLQYIARRFGDLVGKGIPWSVIGEFFLLSLPFTVAMTLPMAMLVAVLYAFSRLASENEVTALKAGGVSMRQLLVPSLWCGTALAAVMVFFNDQILPRANHRLAVLQMDILRTKPTFALREQVINTVKEGQFYLKAAHLDEGSSKMRDVVIYDQSDPVRRRTIYADSGRIEFAPNRRDINMTLHHGSMWTVPTDRPGQLTRLYYERDVLRVPSVAGQFEQTSDADTVTKGDREMSVCEMHAAFARADTSRQRALWDRREAMWLRDSFAIANGGNAPPTDERPRLGAPDSNAGAGGVGRFPGVRPGSAAPAPASSDTPAPKTYAELGPHPARLRFHEPLGIGGLYCDAIGAAAIAVAKVAGSAPERGPMTAQDSAAARRAAFANGGDLPPSAGGLAGIDPGQRLVMAGINLDQANLLRNRYDVEIQKKFSLAVACIIFVLVGAPIALRFPRGGVGLVIGVSFFIFAVYYVGLIGGEELANRGYISAFWAMWSTNVIMTIVGAFLVVRMGLEGNTGRGGDARELLETVRIAIARVARRLGIPMERRSRPA